MSNTATQFEGEGESFVPLFDTHGETNEPHVSLSIKTLHLLKESKNSSVQLVEDALGNRYILKTLNGQSVEANNEATIHSQLRHPQIPAVHAVFRENDKISILMSYVHGETLAQRIQENGAVTWQQAVKWTLMLGQIASRLHENTPYPIIHRDIKPANVILEDNGSIHLIDFGSARYYQPEATTDTRHFGTIGYAAPEQFGYSQTDARSDLFSLGMFMMNLITGKVPPQGFQGTPRAIGKLLGSHHVPHRVRRIILNCTRFNPSERYESARQLQADLRKALQLTFHPCMLSFSSQRLGKTVVACTLAAMTILVGAIIWLTNPIDQQAMAVNSPAEFSGAPLVLEGTSHFIAQPDALSTIPEEGIPVAPNQEAKTPAATEESTMATETGESSVSLFNTFSQQVEAQESEPSPFPSPSPSPAPTGEPAGPSSTAQAEDLTYATPPEEPMNAVQPEEPKITEPTEEPLLADSAEATPEPAMFPLSTLWRGETPIVINGITPLQPSGSLEEGDSIILLTQTPFHIETHNPLRNVRVNRSLLPEAIRDFSHMGIGGYSGSDIESFHKLKADGNYGREQGYGIQMYTDEGYGTHVYERSVINLYRGYELVAFFYFTH